MADIYNFRGRVLLPWETRKRFVALKLRVAYCELQVMESHRLGSWLMRLTPINESLMLLFGDGDEFKLDYYKLNMVYGASQ